MLQSSPSGSCMQRRYHWFCPKSLTSRISGVCRDMYMQKRVRKQAPPFPASVVRALEEYALTCRSESDSTPPSPISFCFAFMPAAALEMPPKSKRFSFQGTRMFSWQKLRPQIQRKLTRWNVVGCFCRSRQLVGDFTQIPGVSCGRCNWTPNWTPWNTKPYMPAFSEVSGQFLDRRLHLRG